MADVTTIFVENDTSTDGNRLLDNVFGSIMISYTLFLTIPYLACIWIFATDPDMSSRPCYKIILHIGITDVFQAVANGIGGGSISIAGGTSFEVSKRLGAVLESFWMSYSMLVNLLAFNRFVQVCFTRHVDRIFSKRGTAILIGLCYLYGLVSFVVFNTNHVSVIYYTDTYIWGYDVNDESIICSYVEMALDLFQLSCMVVWYVGIFVGLKMQTRDVSGSRETVNKKELRVMFQSLLICVLIFLTCFGFFVVPWISNGRVIIFICDLIWLTNCGCNPIIYISFNTALRRKVFALFHLEKLNKIYPNTFVTMNPSVIVVKQAKNENSIIHSVNVSFHSKASH